MRESGENPGFAIPTGLETGLFTGSRRIFADSADAFPDSMHARLNFVVLRAAVYLPADWGIVVRGMQNPAMIDSIVHEVFGGVTPDTGPSLGRQAGVIALSRTLGRVSVLVSEFVSDVAEATTWADLDDAARVLAEVIEELGPEAAFKVLTLGNGPVQNTMSEELGEGGEIVGEDIVREYMGTGGGSKGDAMQRFSKGMKSNVRRNIRQTLEFLNDTDAAKPLDEEDGPSAEAREILAEMNLDGVIMAESIPSDTVLLKTTDGRMGSWFVFQGTKVVSAFKPMYYKVKGSVVALCSVDSSGSRERKLFIPRSMMSGLMHLSAGIDPPPPPPKVPEKKKVPAPQPTGGKPPVVKPGGGKAPTFKASQGNEAGVAKGVQSNVKGSMAGKVNISGKVNLKGK